MKNSRLDVESFLRHRTGFKPGDMPVTCPGCGTTVHGKFCSGCGYEVSAANYEVLQKMFQNGEMTDKEFLEGLNMIPGFKKKTQQTQEMFEAILTGQKQLIEG